MEHHFQIGLATSTARERAERNLANAGILEVFDKIIYGGSGQYNGLSMKVFEDGRHNQPHHIKMLIPPLGISVLKMKKNKTEEPVVEKANEEELDLESKNLTNLKALAKEKGIKGYSQMKKDELIKQIKACK